MDTLHKKLSEIRDLRAEELDLVGGASEEDPYHGDTQTVYTTPYNTWSYDNLSHNIVDDGYVQVFYDQH